MIFGAIVAIAITVGVNTHSPSTHLAHIMATQDLLLLVVLLAPGLLLSVTIMLTFAAGG
jgi:hypothetical protein